MSEVCVVGVVYEDGHGHDTLTIARSCKCLRHGFLQVGVEVPSFRGRADEVWPARAFESDTAIAIRAP